MEEITFTSKDTGEETQFYVLEQTKINGESYLLVTDSPKDGAECLILKDTSCDDSPESLYEIVENDDELNAIAKVFEELLEDIEIER